MTTPTCATEARNPAEMSNIRCHLIGSCIFELNNLDDFRRFVCYETSNVEIGKVEQNDLRQENITYFIFKPVWGSLKFLKFLKLS